MDLFLINPLVNMFHIVSDFMNVIPVHPMPFQISTLFALASPVPSCVFVEGDIRYSRRKRGISCVMDKLRSRRAQGLNSQLGNIRYLVRISKWVW
jgi:hypothetical protein